MTTPDLTRDEWIDVLQASNGKLALRVQDDRYKDSWYVHDNCLRMQHEGVSAAEQGFEAANMLRQDVDAPEATITTVHRSATPFEDNHD